MCIKRSNDILSYNKDPQISRYDLKCSNEFPRLMMNAAMQYLFSAFHYRFRNSFALLIFRSSSFYIPDFNPFSLHSSPPFFLVYYLPFFPSLRTLYRKRRTKETVTSQLAKLLIYSLFNQINERVDVHFYAPVQLFMVYGNCPKRTRASIGRGRDLRPLCKTRFPGDRPFSFRRTSLARLSYILYHFLLVLLPVRFFVYPPSAFDRSKRPYGCLINGVSQSRGVTGL